MGRAIRWSHRPVDRLVPSQVVKQTEVEEGSERMQLAWEPEVVEVLAPVVQLVGWGPRGVVRNSSADT